MLPNEGFFGVAKHVLSRRIDGLDGALLGMEGDNPIRHGVEHRLDERGTIPQGLLHRILFSDIPEHQHGPHHLVFVVANGRATISDRSLHAVS